MYAIIKTGGKQYRVTQGQRLKVETLDAEAGGTVNFDHVLMIGDGEQSQFGQPFVNGAKVMAEVIKHGRADKIRIIRFKRRKHQMKTQGHRQNYTEIKIKSVNI